MTAVYKPWGPLEWLLPRLDGKRWSVLGVLGTEDRCTATLEALAGAEIETTRTLCIHDPAPAPRNLFLQQYAKLGARLISLGAIAGNFRDVQLMAEIDVIRDELNAFLETATPHIILDISSMPKWWFFPLIRMLLDDSRVETLVATYATAEKYGDNLSSDPAPLSPLPTYSEPPDRTTNDELIVGIGFAPLSLRELYAADAKKIRYLFPFPPGPPNFMRNWEFLRTLETEIENRTMEEDDRHYVHMYDCPGVFEALKKFTNDGNRTTALAPFGPKTMSLAMCVFALAASRAGKAPVHVYYTQPRRYALDYTSGIRRVNGVAEVRGYCLRLNGQDVYTV
jgi:hypothetical protein